MKTEIHPTDKRLIEMMKEDEVQKGSSSLCNNLLSGCGNHGCEVKKPSGQATNGRCHCIEAIAAKVQDRIGGKSIRPEHLVKTAIRVTLDLYR